MRIAVACSGLDIAPRYEICDGFMCYLIDDGVITGCQNMPNIGLSIPDFLDVIKELNVHTLIVNAISYDVAQDFCDAGIEIIAGVSGNAREAVEAYLKENLQDVQHLCHITEEDYEPATPLLSLDELEETLFNDR